MEQEEHVKQAKATVTNLYGIHARPSALIAKEMHTRFQGTKVEIDAGEGPNDASDIMGLLAMEMGQGKTVTVTASGPQEQEACDAIAEMIARNFDFER